MAEPFCQGDRVYLRPVELADASLLAKWKSDATVRAMALDPNARASPESQEEDIARAIESDDQLYLILEIKNTAQSIGYIRINWQDDEHRFAWLRFALGEHRGRGYAKDGLRCLLAHLFRHGMHRVDAEVYEFNHVCLGLLGGLGFKEEGLKRQAHFDGQKYWNVSCFGLLAEDLERVQ
jgi:RimJ/RimL family protein N-acetyltransferase